MVLEQRPGRAGGRVDGLHEGVHRPVADALGLPQRAVRVAHHHARARLAAGAAGEVQLLEAVAAALGLDAHLVAHDRLEVHRRDAPLAVGDLLEAREGVVELLAVELVAQLLQGVAQRVAARVLAEHDLALGQAHRGDVHDLVGQRVAEDAVLVDARLVGEGVAADDRLVGLHRVADHAADQPAGAGDLGRDDAAPQAAERVGAGAEDHRQLLDAHVAGPLPDALGGSGAASSRRRSPARASWSAA